MSLKHKMYWYLIDQKFQSTIIGDTVPLIMPCCVAHWLALGMENDFPAKEITND